jgi:hypothetical protein
LNRPASARYQRPPGALVTAVLFTIGQQRTPLKTILTPYSKEKLVDDWDWTGIDILKDRKARRRNKIRIGRDTCTDGSPRKGSKPCMLVVRQVAE